MNATHRNTPELSLGSGERNRSSLRLRPTNAMSARMSVIHTGRRLLRAVRKGGPGGDWSCLVAY